MSLGTTEAFWSNDMRVIRMLAVLSILSLVGCGTEDDDWTAVTADGRSAVTHYETLTSFKEHAYLLFALVSSWLSRNG